jgi:hypothetical protein
LVHVPKLRILGFEAALFVELLRLSFCSQGCRLDFEFVAKGFMYRKGRMKVIISKIHKIVHGQMPNSGETLEPMTGSHLVKQCLFIIQTNILIFHLFLMSVFLRLNLVSSAQP